MLSVRPGCRRPPLPKRTRSKRAALVDEHGLRIQAWPSGSALLNTGESPAVMTSGLDTAVSRLEHLADQIASDIRWGMNQHDGSGDWDRALYDEILGSIERLGEATEDLRAAAVAFGTYAVRLW